ncbi:MAG: carbamoyltransferase [Parcubacteria group bacterium]|jgi:carbamoyltransferase|nr:carbamoyltransferase [Parcubacteria group bacterium]|tara:strand:- start:457 stop:2268 length:1812 start_codon:yes stop_codon:yes gene_type:complete
MLILGIHDGHCASACLLSDEKIIAWVQEERFTREKNIIDFPRKSIESCLEIAGVKGEEIDAVAIATVSFDPNVIRVKRESSFSIEDWIKEQDEYWYPIFYENKPPGSFYLNLKKNEKFAKLSTHYPIEEIDCTLPVPERSRQFGEMRREFTASFLGVDLEKVKLIDHHTCHAMYAFYASPIRNKKVAILTNDGGGDGANGTVWLKDAGLPLMEINRNNCSNLGRVYRYITLLLGMKTAEHEYKVMGLAPYATVREVEKSWSAFKDMFKIKNNLIVPKLKTKDLYFHFKKVLTGHRFDGIAGAVQRMVEKITLDWFEEISKNFGISHFCYSGGVAMNVKLNGLLAMQPFVKSLQVPPSGGDESLSLGASYALLEKHFVDNGKDPDNIPPIESIYLGPDIDSDDLEQSCEEAEKSDDFGVINNVTPQIIAGKLAKGEVIARCSGRMEFGQRALGNRSIFADPRDATIVDRINQKIKYRDFWMPFAPMVLDTDFERYFDKPDFSDSRFMMVALPATVEGIKSISGGLHDFDKTGRPQVLTPGQNSTVYEMLIAFKELTGVGGVINTSFNLHGEPIVCSPVDALHTLKNSFLDGVWMDDILIYRKKR